MKTIKTVMTFLAITLFFAFGTSAMASNANDSNFAAQNLDVPSLGACNLDILEGSSENEEDAPQLTFDIWDFLGAFSTI